VIDFNSFARLMRPSHQYVDFHWQLMHKIMQCVAAPGGRLFVGMPPRHGKSDLASVLLPAWHLTLYPDKQIMHLSHSATLTVGFSLQVRDILRNNWVYRQFFGSPPWGVRNRANDWRLASGGGFMSVGVGGAITGHGADLMIIDDPHNEGDHRSMVEMDKVYDWYTTAARTRLSPGASIVFIMTRWHVQDLAGRLLSQRDGDDWDTFVLPAIAGDDDPLGRRPGDALWPDRYPIDELMRIRANDQRHFQALYQNNPRAGTDVVFDERDFAFVHDEPSINLWSFDLAMSESERADFTVMCGWHENGGHLTLVECIRGRFPFPDSRSLIMMLMVNYPDALFLFPKDLLELAVLSDLRRDMPDAFVYSVHQRGDKVVRAQALAWMASQKRLSVYAHGEGCLHWVHELCLFPDGRYDDCVDAASLVAQYVLDEPMFEPAYA